jgi:hypothetical protein
MVGAISLGFLVAITSMEGLATTLLKEELATIP